MICNRCKKNEATVHVTKIVNNLKEQMSLCEKCAKETGNLVFDDLDSSMSFPFENILSSIMDYINSSNENTKPLETHCPRCRTTYSEFKKKGLLGCVECYELFATMLAPVIKSVQNNTEHIGKIPSKTGKILLEKKKLAKLREELQKAIAIEAYEKAAQIRDEIKELQTGIPCGGRDE